METESETIDDFTQFSEEKCGKTDASVDCYDLQCSIPISRVIPIKVIGFNQESSDKSSDTVSLTEEKDISEDMMVEISKKTTVKKIISTMTSINGIPQKGETEEFIIKNTEINDNKHDGFSQTFKSPKTMSSRKNFDETENVLHVGKTQSVYYDKYKDENLDKPFKGNINIERSSKSNIEIKERNNGPSEMVSTNLDQNWHEKASNGYGKHSKTDSRKTDNKIGRRKHLHYENKNGKSSKNETKGFESNTYDCEFKRKGNLQQVNQDFLDHNSPNGNYLKFMRQTEKQKDGQYLESSKNNTSKMKPNEIDQYISHKQGRSKSSKHQSLNNHMRWVDPLKSLHLKYDLKNNEGIMRKVMHQNRKSLMKSDPNNNINDTITKENQKTRSVNNMTDAKVKNKLHKDIKEYIIRGNVKENVFRTRSPHHHQNRNNHSTQLNQLKPDCSKENRKRHLKSFKSLNNITESNQNPKASLFERQDDSLSLKISEIIDKVDVIEQQIDFNRDNFETPNQDFCDTNSYLRSTCCLVCCHKSISCSCCQCCSFFNHVSMEKNFAPLSKYHSYSSLPYNRNTSLKTLEFTDSGRIQNYKNSGISSSLDFTNDLYCYNDSRTTKKDIYRNQVNNIEKRISSIFKEVNDLKRNERKEYNTFMELENQCQDIERELVPFYNTTDLIREAA